MVNINPTTSKAINPVMTTVLFPKEMIPSEVTMRNAITLKYLLGIKCSIISKNAIKPIPEKF